MSLLNAFFNKGGKFFTLLEEAAREINERVEDLLSFVEAPSISRNMELLAAHDKGGRNITRRIEEELSRTYLPELDREDVLLLAEYMHRISKSIDLLSKNMVAAGEFAQKINFSRQISCMRHSSEILSSMILELRNPHKMTRIRNLFRKVLRYCDRAEDDRMQLVRELYHGGYGPHQAMALRDMYNVCERIMDRFDSTALLILHVSLKNT